MKKCRNAFLGALGVTAISGILLTIGHGAPTKEHLIKYSAEMFIAAFVVLYVWDKKTS